MLPIDHARFQPAMQLIDDGRTGEAIQSLDALSAKLSPKDYAAALYWKVVCLLRLGHVTQARACLDEALAQPDISGSLRICLELQSTYLSEGDGLEKAVAGVRTILSRYAKQFSTPDFFWQYVDAKSYLGKRLSRLGQYSEAIRELEQALSLEPRPAARYRMRIWLSSGYYRLGDMGKARDYLERALIDATSAPKAQLPPDHPARIRYELALIAYKEGRFRDAQGELARASAVAKEPKLVRVITKLKSLLDKVLPA